MRNFNAFFKRNPLKIGCALFIISLLLFVFNYHNSKLNINSLKQNDIVYAAQELNGVGEATMSEIVANEPYSKIEDAQKVQGVGDKKYIEICKNYDTYEPCRRSVFIASICIAVIFCVLGCMFICYSVEKQRAKIKLQEERAERDLKDFRAKLIGNKK